MSETCRGVVAFKLNLLHLYISNVTFKQKRKPFSKSFGIYYDTILLYDLRSVIYFLSQFIPMTELIFVCAEEMGQFVFYVPPFGVFVDHL